MPRRKYPTIKQGDDGLWHAWVTVGTKPNGRPDQRHIKRSAYEEVEARVDELLAQKKTGRVQKPGRSPMFEPWFEEYLDTVAPLRCDLTTVRGYRNKMRRYAYPVIGKTRMNRFGPEHPGSVYVAMARDGLAEATIVQVHRIISRGLKVAYRRGILLVNVAELIEPPTAKKRLMGSPGEEEAGRLLGAAASRRNAVRWKVGLGLGLRQGEALGLRWSDLNLGSKEPQVDVQWQLHRRPFEHGCGDTPCGRRRGGNCPQRVLPLKSGEIPIRGGLILKQPKGKSAGVVPLPPEFVADLKAHREIQDLEKMMASSAYQDRGFVFAGQLGDAISPEADWREWQELEKEAGVEGMFRPHDARHFAATFLLAQGVDVRVVQEILRHSSVKVTEGYAHVASEMARAAMNKVGQKLPKSRTEREGR